MIVAYDGTRFNGFQRQITNQAMENRRQEQEEQQQQQQQQQQQPASHQRPPKRPHFDTTTGKRKHVTVTVQDCLEDAILSYAAASLSSTAATTTQEMCLRFAGRTDKGVHARGQVIAVHLPAPPSSPTTTTTTSSSTTTATFVLEEMKKGINSRLPVDISVEHIHIMGQHGETTPCPSLSLPFDPRHDVKLKTYSYTIKYRRRICQQKIGCDDFTSSPATTTKDTSIYDLGPQSIRSAWDGPCLWVCPWALDDTTLDDLCRQLQGRHNFRAFVHRHQRGGDDDHVLTIDRIHVERHETVSKNSINSSSSSSSYNRGNGAGEGNDDNDDAPNIILARFEFQAKGFRRSMIRNLVGFCVDVCRGHEPAASLGWDDIWSGSDLVARKVNAAPACGLCLESVQY